MNIHDHKRFTKSLLTLPIIQPHILNVSRQQRSIKALDDNQKEWDVIFQHTIVSFKNYLLRDIKMDLQKQMTTHLSEVNADVLDVFFDTSHEQAQRHLHVIGLEDVQNHIVQYCIVLDNTKVVPTFEFQADNVALDNDSLDILDNCYRDLLQLLEIPNTIEEEIGLTVIDDLRNKVSQVLMYGECDNLISIDYNGVGLTDERVQMLREAFYLDLQSQMDAEQFQALSENEIDSLFWKQLDFEIKLYLHTVGDVEDGTFAHLDEE